MSIPLAQPIGDFDHRVEERHAAAGHGKEAFGAARERFDVRGGGHEDLSADCEPDESDRVRRRELGQKLGRAVR